MAFFDIPRDEDIAPGLDELKRVAVSTPCRGDWVTHAPSPQIVKPRVTVEASLFRPSDPSVFSWEAHVIALMVVAHARRCEPSRRSTGCAPIRPCSLWRSASTCS
jgi:hypothetical protein